MAAMRAALPPDEEAGLRLFVGKGRCVTCHGGPLLTDNDFHNHALAAPVGRSELQPLSLSERELVQLEAFLRSLGGFSQRGADDGRPAPQSGRAVGSSASRRPRLA